jgi:hypothetical protein
LTACAPTNKIYTTKVVAEAYPQMERALLRDGSEADLGGLAADARAEGYEWRREGEEAAEAARHDSGTNGSAGSVTAINVV